MPRLRSRERVRQSVRTLSSVVFAASRKRHTARRLGARRRRDCLLRLDAVDGPSYSSDGIAGRVSVNVLVAASKRPMTTYEPWSSRAGKSCRRHWPSPSSGCPARRTAAARRPRCHPGTASGRESGPRGPDPRDRQARGRTRRGFGVLRRGVLPRRLGLLCAAAVSRAATVSAVCRWAGSASGRSGRSPPCDGARGGSVPTMLREAGLCG